MAGREARLIGTMAANSGAGLAMYAAGSMTGVQWWIALPVIVMTWIGSAAGLAPRGSKS